MRKTKIYNILLAISLSLIMTHSTIAQIPKYDFINQEVLNSTYVEDNPIISADGNKIFFNSTRFYPERTWAKFKDVEQRYDYDVYFSKRVNDEWIPPINLGTNINTSEDDVVVSINPEGNIVYYLSFKKGWRNDGGPFYRAEYHGKEWINNVGMGGGIHNFFKTYPGVIYIAGASISPRGKEFYFSTTACAVYGVFDIWVSYLKDGVWAYPKNLGSKINAKNAKNTSPFMSYDERTLFYSSDAFGGYGKKEILFSLLRDDGWSLPLNVGNSINTESDEYQITIPGAGKPIYLVSDKIGGMGAADIYISVLPPDVTPTINTVVIGRVLDTDNQPVGTEILVDDLTRPECSYSTWSNSETGDYSVMLRPGGSYRLYFQKPGYLFATSDYVLPKVDNVKKIIKDEIIQPLNKGVNYASDNIVFESGKSTLHPKSQLELDRIIKLLKENEYVSLDITGHTDDRGSNEYNQILSDERAKAVRIYIIENGNISPVRITAMGYGEDQPIADNNTASGRQKNRRTEFKFKEKIIEGIRK
ncbi:MAG: OmpA family protein [bacterium]